jgi:hypothetical protein
MISEAQEGGTFQISYPDTIRDKLNSSNGTHGWLAALQIDKSAFVAIIDRVRTMVLDWALAMEKAGVHGSEFSFEPAEKKAAQSASTTINIGNIASFAGNLGTGNVAGDISASGVDVTLAQDLVDQLRKRLPEFNEFGVDIETLATRLNQIEDLIKSKAPQSGSTLRGLLIDVKGILVGAAGNLAATGAIATLNAILGTGVPTP